PGCLRHVRPEPCQRSAGALWPTTLHTGGQQNGVDRAGARAADRVKLHVILDQAVEHAPGEGAERAATLKGEREAPLLRIPYDHNRKLRFLRQHQIRRPALADGEVAPALPHPSGFRVPIRTSWSEWPQNQYGSPSSGPCQM